MRGASDCVGDRKRKRVRDENHSYLLILNVTRTKGGSREQGTRTVVWCGKEKDRVAQGQGRERESSSLSSSQ